ncbi:MAG: hypothetical protein ACFB2W_22595 [Leptolyngbyaceae cyanobacterium]
MVMTITDAGVCFSVTDLDAPCCAQKIPNWPSKKGKLTEIEIVSELGIQQTVAKEAPTDLCKQDLAETEMTQSGLLVYIFPDTQQLPTKHSSQGLLDA